MRFCVFGVLTAIRVHVGDKRVNRGDKTITFRDNRERPERPSLEEWLSWTRSILEIWQGFGQGRTKQLHARLSPFYSVEPHSFKSYLYKRVPPEYAKLVQAFAALFHEIDPSLTPQKYVELIQQPSSSATEQTHRLQAFPLEARQPADTDATKAPSLNRNDEYALQVYKWYREHENRQRIGAVARAYYADVAGVLNLPMVTISDWLPESPVPFSEFDEKLKSGWSQNEPQPPVPLLDLLGGERFSDFITRLSPSVKQEDKFCYRLLKVGRKDNSLKLLFGPSSYRHFVSSCEVLSFELGEWCFRHQETFQINPPRSEGSDLPKRGAPEAIFNLGNRCACPGSSTVLILTNHRKGDFFYLQKRIAPELLDSPSGLHVVPSGQFQNDTYEDANHDRGFSLQRNVMREFAEELLGVKEIEGAIENLDDFYDDPRVAPFVAGIEEGSVKGFFLGLGFDPLSTKPGLLSALVIDASRIPEPALEFIHNWEGKLLPEPLKDLERRSRDFRLIPDGATCLRLAHRHLDFLLGKKEL